MPGRKKKSTRNYRITPKQDRVIHLLKEDETRYILVHAEDGRPAEYDIRDEDGNIFESLIERTFISMYELGLIKQVETWRPAIHVYQEKFKPV